jgi:GntR family transcriptional regulator, transcriptional repressor for pyruvate dehydrogenase complex
MNLRANTGSVKTEIAVTGSAADNLANHLKKAILEGQVAVGDSLPPERELMSQFGVSRSTVREALRMLDARGLIEVRRGRTGGSYISNPPPELVVQSLDMFIKGHELRLMDLVLAREAIECAAAAQAAVCRTDEQLETLRQCCVACEETLPDVRAFVEANLAWHVALVQSSTNPLFITFMASIASAMHAATDSAEFDLKIRKTVVGVHWQIYLAIRDRDPEAARRRMLRHLSAYGEKVKSIDFDRKDA